MSVGINEIVNQIKEKTNFKEAEIKETLVKFLEVVKKNLNKGESISFKNYFTLQRQKTEPNISKYCIRHENPIESFRQKNKGKGIKVFSSSPVWRKLVAETKDCSGCKKKKDEIIKATKLKDRLSLKANEGFFNKTKK